MQVVQGMDEIHTGMGSVLVLLHTPGIRVFQGTERRPLCP